MGAKKHQRRVLVFQSWEEAHRYFKEMEELRLRRAIKRQFMKTIQTRNPVIISNATLPIERRSHNVQYDNSLNPLIIREELLPCHGRGHGLRR